MALLSEEPVQNDFAITNTYSGTRLSAYDAETHTITVAGDISHDGTMRDRNVGNRTATPFLVASSRVQPRMFHEPNYASNA